MDGIDILATIIIVHTIMDIITTIEIITIMTDIGTTDMIIIDMIIIIMTIIGIILGIAKVLRHSIIIDITDTEDITGIIQAERVIID